MKGWTRGIALLVALAAVFVFRVQDLNLTPLIGAVDNRRFVQYTPYFPGLRALDRHEIFSPANTAKKKIVFLGASTVDSIGLDYTWHRPPPGVAPNVHAWGSIAGQLTEVLRASGRGDWEAYNLARNGAKLTSMLYVYARILPLKPEVVVMGEAYEVDYKLWRNADADALDAQQYAYLDKTFGMYPETASIWSSYLDNLERHGWKRPPHVPPEVDYVVGPVPRERTSVLDLAEWLFANVEAAHLVPAIPRPVQYAVMREWTLPKVYPAEFDNLDPDFAYFRGIRLIAELQRRNGGRFFFYFSPQWEHHADAVYIEGLQNNFCAYMDMHGIPHANYVPVEMRPVFETYDGYHQTLAGNRRIAQMIYEDLVTRNLLE